MFRHASKNRAFRLVWNADLLMFVPAPEGARAPGKRAGGARVAAGAAMAGLLASTAANAVDPLTQPGGGRVVGGQAAVTQTVDTTTVRQTSPRAAIDWQSFSVGSQARVDFVQPSPAAVVLNRVVGQEPTQVLGRIQANGQVFIVNPNGVLFAPGARVDAAGVLASTRDMAVADFMADRLVLSGRSAAPVVNGGSLGAGRGGYVVLVGAQVINEGSVAAPHGDIRMAAADRVTLRIDDGGLASFSVDRGTLDGLVANRGLLRAEGGRVFLTADALDALSRAVVNNEGVIEARTVDNHAGTIVLKGDMAHGQAVVGGTLDASAPAGGNGGFVETSAAQVQLASEARVTTAAPQAGSSAGTWLIDPTDFRIAATGGNMTGAQLATALGSGNVTVQSTAGTGGTAGKVTVDDSVAWSANRLTLDAQGDIQLNAHLAGSGTASLALRFGQSSVAAGNTARYSLADGVTIDLPAGNTFSTKKGSDGSVVSFQVITSLGADGSTTGTDLQGLRGGLSGHYALGADIAAAATATWQSGQGFVPIGTLATPFQGDFEGLGHTIDGLAMNRSTSASGLFGKLGASGSVSNVDLTHVAVTQTGTDLLQSANVGGLVGYNAGRVEHVSVQGTVRSASIYVGGVVGTNDGLVTGSKAVDIDVSSTAATVGGLVGYNAAGSVVASSSSGRVSGDSYVGGLIGMSLSGLSGLSSSASVTGGSNTGGLAGQINGGVADSSASGNVVGVNATGGLVGFTKGAISGSFATGNVTSTGSGVGGLVGSAGEQDIGYGSGPTTLSNSYATGRVSSTGSAVGGLVGDASGIGNPSTNVYATGAVSGADNVGGLFGLWASSYQGGALTASHASGDVSGGSHVGGLIGNMEACFCDLSSAYASGNVVATGNQVGGLVGGIDAGALSNVHASGNVSGRDQVGGLAGYAKDVSNAYASGNVSGRGAVGGLVGRSKVGGTISGVHANGDVTGTGTGVGGLVGHNDASIASAAATGAVRGSGNEAGGFVGTAGSGSITDSTASGRVDGSGSVGGFVGSAAAGTVFSHTSASGDVSGSSNVGGYVGSNATVLSGNAVDGNSATGRVTGTGSGGGVGGYAGSNGGSLHRVIASGAVSETGGGSDVGGLVGVNEVGGVIDESHATGAVASDGSHVGGLVGRNAGSIGNAWAAGAVGGVDQVGGLVGVDEGHVEIAYASGAVRGRASVGGLTGQQSAGAVTLNAYATGDVLGDTAVGGLFGSTSGSTRFAYANGAVRSTGSGTTDVGGFAGVSAQATIADSFFDVDRSGHANASGSALQTTGAALGKTTAEMNTAATFTGWSLASTGSRGLTWRSYDGLAAPLLTHWLTPMTITGNGSAITQVYDGTIHSQSTQVSFTETLPAGHLLGMTQYVGARNVGVYDTIGGNWSDPQGYDLSYTTPGRLTITPRPVTVAVTGGDKVYDGTLAAAVTVSVGGAVAGDSFVVTGMGRFSTPEVGVGKPVTVSLTATGADVANYSVATTATTVANITAVPVVPVMPVVPVVPVMPVVPITPVSPVMPPVEPPAAISSQQPTPSLASALVSLPNLPSGADGNGPQTAGTPGRGDSLVKGTIAADSVGSVDGVTSADDGRRPVSVVSGNTRENLLYRRTFSIGDGGIRLPAGVVGSEKDASQ